MSEANATELVDEPVTVSSLVTDLRELGLQSGETVIVHSSLSSLGWVSGGAQTVVDALQTVMTDSGTLAMPTHTGQCTDPETWSNPPVPDDWVATIRETMPPFRPDVTPTRGVGAIPECFRNYPGVRRSAHPIVSVAAWGADANELVEDHPLGFGLGEESPLARLYDLDANILLLGVGHVVNTSLHLAEYRADLGQVPTTFDAPILEDGRRVRVEYEDIRTDTADFPDLGRDFERRIGLEEGSVGAATAKLASQPAMVDFAVDWLEANR